MWQAMQNRDREGSTYKANRPHKLCRQGEEKDTVRASLLLAGCTHTIHCLQYPRPQYLAVSQPIDGMSVFVPLPGNCITDLTKLSRMGGKLRLKHTGLMQTNETAVLDTEVEMVEAAEQIRQENDDGAKPNEGAAPELVPLLNHHSCLPLCNTFAKCHNVSRYLSLP